MKTRRCAGGSADLFGKHDEATKQESDHTSEYGARYREQDAHHFGSKGQGSYGIDRDPRPTRGPRFEVWECSIRIDGLASAPITDSVTGSDSLQALLLGMQCIRWHLMQSGAKFEWLGESLLGGDNGGIPRFPQIGMGQEFDERMDAAIIRETERTRKFRAPIMRRWLVEAGISTSRSGRKD
jgi:hypothetical protein